MDLQDLRTRNIWRISSLLLISFGISIFLSLTAFSADSGSQCTSGKYKIAVQYSLSKSASPTVIGDYRRGTPTALNNTGTNYISASDNRRGTPTALAVLTATKLAISDYLISNPSAPIDPEVVVIDDESSRLKSVNAANTILADQCVLGVIGPQNSAMAKVAIPIYSAAGIPVLTTTADSEGLARKSTDTFYRLVLPKDYNDIELIKYLQTKKYTSPVIFEDTYTEPNLLNRWAVNSNYGVYSINDLKNGTENFAGVKEVIAKSVDAVVIDSFNEYEVRNFSTVLRKYGYAGEILVNRRLNNFQFFDGISSLAPITIFGKSVPLHLAKPSFENKYLSIYNANTSTARTSIFEDYITESYDAATFLMEGISSGSRTRSELNTYIKTKKINGISGPVSFNKIGEIQDRSVPIYRYTDKWEILQGFPSNYAADFSVTSSSIQNPYATSILINVKDYDASIVTSRVSVSNGIFSKETITNTSGGTTLKLPSGKSILTVFPTTYEIGLRRNQYEVSVVGANVTSVKRLFDGVLISPTAGVYDLRLATPTFVGTISSAQNYSGSDVWSTQYFDSNFEQSDKWSYATNDGRFAAVNSSNKFFATFLPLFTRVFTARDSNPQSFLTDLQADFQLEPSSVTGNPTLGSLSFVASNIKGTVGDVPAGSKVSLLKKNQSQWIEYGSRFITNEGNFGFAGKIGTEYKIRAYSIVGGLKNGFIESETFTLTALGKTLALTLPASKLNVKAVINSTSPGVARFLIYRQNQFQNPVFSGVTDSNGEASINAPIGTYRIVYQGKTRNSSYQNIVYTGTSFRYTSSDCVAVEDDAKCITELIGPNIRGEVTGLQTYTKASITFAFEYIPGKFVYKGPTFPIDENGNYEGFIQQDKSWGLVLNYSDQNNRMSIPVGFCSTTSIITTCNVDLANYAKFKFDIRDLSDNKITTTNNSVKLTVTRSSGGNSVVVCCSQLSPSDIPYNLTLDDGSYEVQVNPPLTSIIGGGSNSFAVIVSGGEITSVTDNSTDANLISISGVYKLSLGRVILAGIVYDSDGVTPVPRPNVVLVDPTTNIRYSADSSLVTGEYFFGSKIPDGVYNLSANVNFNNKTSLVSTESGSESITVNQANAAQNLSRNIIFKNPNFIGVVSGSTGSLSQSNLIQLFKLGGCDSCWNWVGKWRYTDTLGKFSFYVEPGTYRIRANNDAVVNGIAGYSEKCTVALDAVTTCNLILKMPNVSGTYSQNIGDYLDLIPSQLNPVGSPLEYVSNVIIDTGTNSFKAYAGPGKYRIRVNYFDDNLGAYLPTQICDVVITISNTCNSVLPTSKFSFRLNNSTYVGMSDNYQVAIELLEDKSYLSGFYVWPRNGSNAVKEIPLIDGSYKITFIPYGSGYGISVRYVLDIVNGQVINVRLDGSTTAVNAVNGVFDFTLRKPALSGVVLKSPGVPSAYSQVAIRRIGDSNKNFSYWSGTDSQGKFIFDLGENAVDGVYEIIAAADAKDNSYGNSTTVRVTVKDGVGSTSPTLNLRKVNVIGTVRGSKGVSPVNWLSIRKIVNSGESEYPIFSGKATNSLGQFGVFLDPGTYEITAQSDMDKAGGTSKTVTCEVSETDTDLATKTCDIALSVPNLTGKVTIDGVSTEGSLQLFKNNGRYLEWVNLYAYVKSDGNFALNVPVGEYRTLFYSYKKNMQVNGPVCKITGTDTTVCDVNLPGENLKFNVTSSSGSKITSDVTACVILMYETEKDFGTGCASLSNFQDGTFKFNLLDGIYRIEVYPQGNQKGTNQSFEVEIKSNVVTSVKRNGVALSAVNGIFNFQLGAPAVSGTVVAPDGTTPVPNSAITTYSLSNNWSWSGIASSNTEGYFGIPSRYLPDGVYKFVAEPPFGDSTKGNSAPVSATVANRTSGLPINLPLRTPNISGVVRSPAGTPIPFSHVWVERIGSNSQRESVNGVQGVATDGSGKYAFYLDPGTYRFRSQSRYQDFGGMQGNSSNCAVPATTSCDITLPAPNINFKITNPNSEVINRNAYSYGYFTSGTEAERSQINEYWINAECDNLRICRTYLQDGKWTFIVQPGSSDSANGKAQYTVSVSSGAITSVENEFGQTLSIGTDGSYKLALSASNVQGTVQYKSADYNGPAEIRLIRENQDWREQIDRTYSSDGKFGFKTLPGNYLIEVTPYKSVLNTAGELVGLPTVSEKCVVPQTGNVQCNVTLKDSNLLGVVTNPTNNEVFKQADAYLYSADQDKGLRYLQFLQLNNGKFSAYLQNGKYQIQINPEWNLRKSFSERSYEVTVVDGIVTAVLDLQKNLPVLPNTDGTYTFKVGVPSVKGSVKNASGIELIPNASVRISSQETGEKWRYSAATDATGEFALTVPDGTYWAQAFPAYKDSLYGKSLRIKFVITGGEIASVMDDASIKSLDLRMRAPNFNGRVMDPTGTNPVPDVNVNVWIDGEYFYAYTGPTGEFSGFIENSTPRCPQYCSINLNPWGQSDFTSVNLPVNSIGNIGDVRVGGVNARITVSMPVGATPNKFGWISVESWVSFGGDNGYWNYFSGNNTDNLGRAGLNLIQGSKYRLTAYPSGDNYSKYSAKSLVIDSFDVASSDFEIIFDAPNYSFTVKDKNGLGNRWGWYVVRKLNETTENYDYFLNNYLDVLGQSSVFLPVGEFKVTFYPGKNVVGTEKSVTFTRTADTPLTELPLVTLPTGNVTGQVSKNGSSALGILISATSNETTPRVITSVTSSDGTFEMNLDRSVTWSIVALDPDTGIALSPTALATDPSSSAVATVNFSIVSAG